jgi:hypothetical protein
MRSSGARRSSKARDYDIEEVTTAEEEAEQVRMYAVGLKKLGRPVKDGSVVYLEGGRMDLEKRRWRLMMERLPGRRRGRRQDPGSALRPVRVVQVHLRLFPHFIRSRRCHIQCELL